MSTGEKKRIVIATRNSVLALWQAKFVREKLYLRDGSFDIQILPITTEGDRRLDESLANIGGKGLFIKELEQALRQGKADIAVHSMKDMPYALPEGFILASILEREDPRDVFLSNKVNNLSLLPKGSRVGTSSFRRSSQLLSNYNGISVLPLRGNLETRLRKLDEGKYDAIILAAAGVKRLNMTHRISSFLDPYQFIPAVGQGAIGIECLAERADLFNHLAAIEHQPTRWCVDAERTMTAKLGGECNLPIAGLARIMGSEKKMRGFVGHPNGSTTLYNEEFQSIGESSKQLGENVARGLINQGALELLGKLVG